MANALNNPATMLEIFANRALITAMGKALVNKNVISGADIASELSEFIKAAEAGGGGDPLLIAELKHILGAVVTW